MSEADRMEESKVDQLVGALVYGDSRTVVPVSAAPQQHLKSHGLDNLEEGHGHSISISQQQHQQQAASEQAGQPPSGLIALQALAGSDNLTRFRNAFQKQSPPRSPTDDLAGVDRQSSPSTLDTTVNQILNNTISGQLWSPTPRAMVSTSPSPIMGQNSATPGDGSSQDDDFSLTPVDTVSDVDKKLEDANKEISKLTRQTFQMSAEKELVEGDLEFWKQRALQLEQRLMNAEEDAIKKEHQVEELERQLEIARQPIMPISPITHPCSRSPASDEHQSVNSQHSADQRHVTFTSHSSPTLNTPYPPVRQPLFRSAGGYPLQQHPQTHMQHSVYGHVPTMPMVDTQMKPLFADLLQAIQGIVLKLIWRAQHSSKKFHADLRTFISKAMQNQSVQQALKYLNANVLPSAGWAGLSVFIVVVLTGFLQVWKQGAKTLLTWLS